MKIKVVLLVVSILLFSISVFAQKKTDGKNNSEENVRKILAAFQSKDLKTMTDFMSDKILLVQPLTLSGSTESAAMTRYEGKMAVSGFLQSLFTNFKELKINDIATFPTNDGKIVFVEMKSRFVLPNDAVYQNIYVFKYEFENEKVVKVSEYFNPVPIAETLKLKLGKQ